MTALIENSQNSLTTGKETENASSIGSQLSVIGLETTKNIIAQTPEENNKSLGQMLKSTLKSCVKFKEKTIFTEYGAEYRTIILFEGLNDEQLRQAEEILNAFLTPLPKDRILKGLTRLQVICPEKQKNEIDKQVRTKIYVEELSKYPADVVIKALMTKFKWFPALAELLDICDNEMTFRELVKKGLRNART